MLFLRILSLLCLFTANIRASSHWVVTETGLIRSKEESPFLLADSSDLLSFINQEIRWQNTFAMYDDLLIKQKLINSMWVELEDQSDITTHVTESENCKAVGEIENVDWYKTFLEDGSNIGIAESEFMLSVVEEFGDIEIPDCKKISSLTYSMCSFEHLEAMINRGQLNATPETVLGLPEIFSSIESVKEYGHWISETLRRNTTSWLHYNLAAIYWRIKGNVPKALECSRRAVHHCPRQYKPIPLLCMGSILHRSKMTDDAIVVLGAAVDHNPTLHLSHFTLGEAYAVIGDFNSSMKHFNMSIKLRPDYVLAFKYRNAVLCHIDLLTKMQYAQRTISKLSVELEEFRDLETQWLNVHAALLKTMDHKKKYDYKKVEKNCNKMEDMTQLKITELRKERDRNALVKYLVNNPLYSEEWKNERGVSALNIAYDFEKAVKRVAEQAGTVNENLIGYNTQLQRNKTKFLDEIGPKLVLPDIYQEPLKLISQAQTDIKAEIKVLRKLSKTTTGDDTEHVKLKKTENGKVLYPSNMKVDRNKMDFDIDLKWPTNAFCQEAKANFPSDIDDVYPVFMPFEHKGISLKTVLTEKIGVSALEEYELPWHPPLCPTDRELALYTTKKGVKVQMVSEDIATKFLRQNLLKYVSHDKYDVIKNKEDAEIGQRIHTAIEKRLASKWVLYTLASLYWRVRGNTINALNCLLTASRTADTRYRDVVLVSLASVFFEMGLLDDALVTVEEAYRLSPYEPPTNFLLAQLHLVRKNQKAQFFHLKQAVRVDPRYMGGYARCLLNAWACIAMQVHTLRELGVLSADIDGEQELCAETEPGVSMVCARDGTNCRLTSRRCSQGQGSTKESSTLVRMLELENDIQKAHMPPLQSSFNNIINMMPIDRTDIAGHQRNYDMMMETYKEVVMACRKYGCGVNMHILNLQREECEFIVLDLEYWLRYITFQQELTEPEIQMSSEVATIIPTNKKVPECKIPLETSDDYFTSRILKVDTGNWAPVASLVQHIGILYSQFDFLALGAKFARYVETKPKSWAGALASTWWCGAAGHGACAARCAATALALAPTQRAHLALRPLAALLHMQRRHSDATDIALLSLYTAPKNKIEAVLVGISHHYKNNINEALWMYRYALTFDPGYIPATACLHTGMCILTFGNDFNKHQRPN